VRQQGTSGSLSEPLKLAQPDHELVPTGAGLVHNVVGGCFSNPTDPWNASTIKCSCACFLKRGKPESPGPLQIRIAFEWDSFEKTLQGADFWSFLTNDTEKRGSRIDFVST
jgi:hypothetical protein